MPVIVIEMTKHQNEIYEMLRSYGYQNFIGTDKKSVIPGIWPANLIASMQLVSIPERFVSAR